MRFLLLLILLGFSPTFAQTCQTELQGELSGEALAAPASALQAAELFRRAVELLEPALPQLQTAESLPLAPGEEGYETVRYLAERGLLPLAWQPGALTIEVWEAMLRGLWSWYRAAPLAPSSELTVSSLIDDLSLLIERVAPDLRPVALVASESAERERVAFWAVIRNRSVYPRLIVSRPLEGVTLQAGVVSVLPLLSSCVQPLTNYVYAPAETARRLFLANNQAQMYLVASSPGEMQGVQLVPEGEEADYLAFRSSELDGLDAYAAVFDGPRASPAALLRLLPQVRTNMNPRELLQLLAP